MWPTCITRTVRTARRQATCDGMAVSGGLGPGVAGWRARDEAVARHPTERRLRGVFERAAHGQRL